MAEEGPGGSLFRKRLAALDRSLLIVVLGFSMAMPWSVISDLLAPTWLHGIFVPGNRDLDAAYEAAVVQSAVRRPTDAWPLMRLQGDSVELVRLTDRALQPGAMPAPGMLWASLPDDLRRFCGKSREPLLKLQQALGLPGKDGDFKVIPLKVDIGKVRRPCFSGHSPTDSACTPSLPDLPNEDIAGGATEIEKEELKKRRQHALVWTHDWAKHALSSWQIGRGGKSQGYPFTGMGWTWNWDPDAPHPVGVSEFVIPKGTTILVGLPMTPAQFCGARG